MTPEIAQSRLTGKWYIVTRRRKDGSASVKYDVTDQIETILQESQRAPQNDAIFANRCYSFLRHGPGHQSKTYCEAIGAHTIHFASYGETLQQAAWTGNVATSSFFDEPPEVKDD